eukprot:Blabericola_migrator_1__13352@NODE_944_length_5940_cov_31_343436_g655_i0_p2_GENE_NODE_944_length_5940_cov_31_343436_g655_i0NODE_944_length_5940_cov_31_343436_g655_i0_p2_ORF_typecomplete_len555_score97_53Tubulin/PF00091_25/3_9e37Tubulin_C/PF03953_17/3_2e06Tubulin_2/PF13809_6/9_3e05Tubulin_3/PF14881_6/0_0062_NODE_944_length_5940_cov_31_343436_g655_i03241988
MRECVSVHLGQAGCGAGRAVWKLFCHEHDIGPDGQLISYLAPPSQNSTDAPDQSHEANLEPFFCERDWCYTPRAIFYDTDPGGVVAFDNTKPFNHLFRPSNLVFGYPNDSTQNLMPLAVKSFSSCWASSPPHSFKHVLRKELERCDHPTSFFITGSAAGATGSGASVALLEHLKQMGPKISIVYMCHMPSPNSSLTTNSILGTCNTCLAMPHIADLSDMALVYDNEALFDAALNHLEIPEASFTLLNDIVAALAGALTCPVRFPYSKRAHGLSTEGLIYNTLDLPAICETLVPIHKLPFVVGGFAPITSVRSNISLEKEVPSYSLKLKNTSAPQGEETRSQLGRRKPSVRELCWSLYSPENMMSSIDPYRGRFLKSLVIFRGPEVTRDEVIRQTLAIEHHGFQDMTDMWLLRMPKRLHCYTFKVPERQLMMSASFFGILTSTGERLAQINSDFESVLERNAFLHRYLEAGVEKEELEAARNRMGDMAKQYEGLEQLINLKEGDGEVRNEEEEEGEALTKKTSLATILDKKMDPGEVADAEEAFLLRHKIKFLWP